MGSWRKTVLAGLAVVVVCAALGVRAEDEEYKLTKPPAWSEDAGSFGWECDPDIGEARECAFVGSPSPGISPPGEDAFAERFEWSTVDEVETRKGRDRGTCQLFLKPKVGGDLREIMVVRIQSIELGGVSDAMCKVVFSPDGSLVGVAAAWADFEGTEDYVARAYTIEKLESLYWSILGRKIYKKKPEEGEKYFHWALALDPSDHRARYKLACLLARAGRTEEAIIQLAEAISLSPKQLRKRARKDRELGSLKKDESFKILVTKTEGYKEIRGSLGTPPADELPPGIEELKERIEQAASRSAEPVEAEPDSRSAEPVEAEGGLKSKIKGLLEKVGCSAALVA